MFLITCSRYIEGNVDNADLIKTNFNIKLELKNEDEKVNNLEMTKTDSKIKLKLKNEEKLKINNTLTTSFVSAKKL